MKLRPRTQDRSRCNYCHGDLEEVEETCSACKATYHRDCLHTGLSGVCANPGCGTLAMIDPEGLPESTLLRCCEETLPRERHFQCSACRGIQHESCIARVGPCCMGGFTQVGAVRRAPKTPEQEKRQEELRELRGAVRVVLRLVPLVIGVGVAVALFKGLFGDAYRPLGILLAFALTAASPLLLRKRRR